MGKAIVFLLIFVGSVSLRAQEEIERKSYDTEFGAVDLWIYGNQITGSYEIKPKKIIGSMRAILVDNKAIGRWYDPDGVGDIELTFTADFTKVSIDYRADNDPDKWYRGTWHGTQANIDKQQANDGSCNTPSHQLIRPFLGAWEEFEMKENGDQEFIGTLEVRLIANGCSLVQRFISPDSSFSYSTMGFVNPGSGIWEETYTFSTGAFAVYQWVLDAGDIVQRKVGGSRQMDHVYQLRFTEVGADGYVVIQERSEDGGKTWKQSDRTRVNRKSK